MVTCCIYVSDRLLLDARLLLLAPCCAILVSDITAFFLRFCFAIPRWLVSGENESFPIWRGRIALVVASIGIWRQDNASYLKFTTVQKLGEFGWVFRLDLKDLIKLGGVLRGRIP